jgi:hypothetical protein
MGDHLVKKGICLRNKRGRRGLKCYLLLATEYANDQEENSKFFHFSFFRDKKWSHQQAA